MFKPSSSYYQLDDGHLLHTWATAVYLHSVALLPVDPVLAQVVTERYAQVPTFRVRVDLILSQMNLQPSQAIGVPVLQEPRLPAIPEGGAQ